MEGIKKYKNNKTNLAASLTHAHSHTKKIKKVGGGLCSFERSHFNLLCRYEGLGK